MASDDRALANVTALHQRTPMDVAREYGKLLVHAGEVIDQLREGNEHDDILCAECPRLTSNIRALRGAIVTFPR